MSRTAIALFVGILLGAAGARLYVPSSEATSEEQAEPYYKVLFENDAVRIVDHRLAPGEREPEHTHAPMVGYFIQGATVMVTEADGSTSEVTLPTGRFGGADNRTWWTHSLENTGDTALHSILVEFKNEQPRR